MIEKIYLETDDEITSVIDKIKKTNSTNVDVIVPNRATLIQSIVNLKLLKRQSDFLEKKLTLFINDEKGINLATKAGLKIETNLKNKDININQEKKAKSNSNKSLNVSKVDFSNKINNAEPIVKKNINKNKQDAEVKDDSLFAGITKKINSFGNDKDQDDKVEKSQKKEVNKYFKINPKGKVHLLPSVNLRSFLIFFGISVLVIAVIFMMILPTANITVKPKTEPFSTSFEVVISNNVETLDIENIVLPGETITHEEKSDKQKFKATGEKDVGEKAKGEIVVYNNYSSDPITLIPSTRFVSADKTFFTLHEITIPGASIEGGIAVAGTTKVRVEADFEGEEYNIRPTRFIIPNLPTDKQNGIYGESITAFSGGSSRIVKVISDEDYENAKNKLFESTFDKMIDSLSGKIGENKILATGIMKKEIVEINSSPGSGEEADEFELDIKVKVIGYSVDRDDIDVIINNKFSELVPEDKYIINNDITEGIDFEPIHGVVSDEDSIAAQINITKQVAWKLDEKNIKDNIKGMNIEDAKDYMSQNKNIISVDLSFWPFWVRSVPKNYKKIKIMLDTDNNDDKLSTINIKDKIRLI